MPPTRELPELPTLEANIRITGTDRERLGKLVVRHYKAGVSCREISEKIARSYGFVHSLLEDQGIAMRSRGGAQVRGTGTTSKATASVPAQKTEAPKGKSKAQIKAEEHAAAKEAAREQVEVPTGPVMGKASAAARAAAKAKVSAKA